VVSPLILSLLFLGPAWGWYLMIAAATCVAGYELFSMTHPTDGVSRALGTALVATVSVALYCFTFDARALLTLLFFVPIAGALLPLWRLGEIETAALRTTALIAGPAYVGLLTTLALIRRDLGDTEGPGFVLMTLMFAWMADTGGYFAGRFLGKRPLYPAVSPKKTVEGFWGALAGGVLGGLLAHFWYLRTLPLVDAVVLGLVCGVLGQLGDLAESLLKRSTAHKDSGNIIPGHGGMFDRVDALLIVSPVVYLYALWTGRILAGG
jgi:phosphatidate cytidylyltransferase